MKASSDQHNSWSLTDVTEFAGGYQMIHIRSLENNTRIRPKPNQNFHKKSTIQAI